MKLPERVTICEVGTRDGFQIEPDFIPTEQKVEVVNLLSDARVPRIEVTSSVHPKAVPQLSDAAEVDKLIATSKRVQQIVGRTLPGQIVKAGASTRRYPVPATVAARIPRDA